MKYIIVFIALLSLNLYSQTTSNKDSISYFSTQTTENIKANKYKNALLYTQKAINFSEANRNISAQADQTYILGKIYFDLQKYDDAIDSFTESISLFEQTNKTTTNLATAYYYQGLALIEKSNFSTAEIALHKAKYFFNQLKNTDYDELLDLQEGIIYRNNGNFEMATSLFNNIVAKPLTTTSANSIAEAFYQIGLIEKENNRNNLAISYFNRALTINENQENLEQKAKILLALSNVYNTILDKSNAYSYLKMHLNLKENLSLVNNEKLGIDDYENFKETQRLNKLEKVQKQNIENERTNKFSKLINLLSVSLISILSLLSFSLYKTNKIKKKSNQLLQEKNSELIVEKEKTEKASQARSDFLSTVSHELRTPLNAINGITHLLLEEDPKKSQLHYLSSLKFSSNYLATFINEILEVNRIDSNKVEIEYINFNIKNLLEDIKNSLQEQAIKNNNNFSLTIDPKIPDNLIGDPTKLSQIFMNLINNALKFTKDGKVNVTAKLITGDTKTAKIWFDITDTGIGIPDDKQEIIFESFSQGSVAINRKYGGTGLGLTIVKKLIEILGGTIALKSKLGKGSTFTFGLDFIVDSNPVQITEKPEITELDTLKNKKILIVEDNKINQMITKRMVENRGAITEIIDNGEDAIELIKNNDYELVLMDVHLPGINGTIATQKVRKFNTKLPIIALTAISLNENREMLLSFGMNDVIMKPFVPEKFYQVIAQTLAKF